MSMSQSVLQQLGGPPSTLLAQSGSQNAAAALGVTGPTAVPAAPQADQGQQLWVQTLNQFPILKNYPIDYAYTPKESGDMLESYPPEEEQRPDSLPKGRFGVEVYQAKTSPMDLMGDIASHYAVYHDPKMAEMYQQFQANIPPAGQDALKDLYEESKRDDNETRPYNEWLSASGMPAYLRGKLVNQFKDTDYPGAYSPQQMQILSQMKQYLGIPDTPPVSTQPASP